MRLFIAIRLQLSQEYNSLRNELQRRTPYDYITWVANDLSHLTLRFIGKTHSSQVKPIAEALQNIAANTPELDLEINKLGVFGSHYAPKVLWLGISNTPELKPFLITDDIKYLGDGAYMNDGIVCSITNP